MHFIQPLHRSSDDGHYWAEVSHFSLATISDGYWRNLVAPPAAKREATDAAPHRCGLERKRAATDRDGIILVKEDDGPFDAETLRHLYAAISSVDGVTVAELRSHVAAFSTRPIWREDIQAYREGRKPWKKLRDEVVPVERFLSALYPDDTRVRFPLNDQPPDAWLTFEDRTAPIGIEVTGALARAGIEIGKSLADGRLVPGFIPLQDDATLAEFARVRTRGRIMHAPKGIDRTIREAIRRRLAAKDDSKFAGYILLITAPVGSASDRSAVDLQATLGSMAKRMPFSEIFVISGVRSSPIVKLK